ncbi:hypothetical protein AD945_03205 [Gluconobacter albidus]|uniref:Uncharacterized protein n=1 Tax=Gluconobacter albidus TaxID=318683 RepID=A0A149TLU3_9PROT|nr:hypothetical protein AD945_03205 [Gluconobacter albidus]
MARQRVGRKRKSRSRTHFQVRGSPCGRQAGGPFADCCCQARRPLNQEQADRLPRPSRPRR